MTGLERIGATVVFVTLKACTAQAPNWHPNADEMLYIVKGGPHSSAPVDTARQGAVCTVLHCCTVP